MDADGTLWGEVPLTPVRDSHPLTRRTFQLAVEETRIPQPRPAPEVPEDVPGWGMKPDPLNATTVPEFLDTMARYRRWAGEPSYREMARRVGTGSAAGFCEALKADKLPKFTVLNAFVVALGGTSEDFQRWATAWRALDGQTSGSPLMLLLPRTKKCS
jgi:hypothetical protein